MSGFCISSFGSFRFSSIHILGLTREYTFFSILFVPFLLLLSHHFVVMGLIAVERVYKKFNVLHLLDTKGLPDRIDLDWELLLEWLALALFKRLVINEIWALLDKHFEDILDLLVLVTNVMCVSSDDRLIITNKLALALGLISLTIHDWRILVHHRVALCSWVSSLVAWVTCSRVWLREEGKEWIRRRFPWDW